MNNLAAAVASTSAWLPEALAVLAIGMTMTIPAFAKAGDKIPVAVCASRANGLRRRSSPAL
ncbi:hypothetical protein [Rhizobium glycinendophyticum]|uniref:Uncharacterized protein n=1 Tax=Rhizobium glycinendophyticum TaxID=2589807 RepID=A0A504V1T8_9HYPH|nr:hypothetical protein [Rhizobium glycinendophyticum]TPP11392.1 hypothetical protein FJQ55_11460 [Rhizobium glycinendophyticum]